MAEFTNADRIVIEAEGAMWSILEGFKGATRELVGEFYLDAQAIQKSISKFATDLRDYNDQFETSE